jgi:hypothetical protein
MRIVVLDRGRRVMLCFGCEWERVAASKVEDGSPNYILLDYWNNLSLRIKTFNSVLSTKKYIST